MIRYEHLQSVDSTNSYMKLMHRDMADMTMLTATEQTAGRGQRGNSWESQPGENLTFSLFKRHDGFEANRQFALSEAVALAIVDALSQYGITAAVKWPNDIYVGNKKICGILIEHSVSGRLLSHSIIGVGINVNQTEFLSDAPNPVSMARIAGRRFPVDDVKTTVGESLARHLQSVYSDTDRTDLHKRFMDNLWRGHGVVAPYRDAATGEEFAASIQDVEPTGHLLLLQQPDGTLRRYAFKEVAFVLDA